MAAPPPPLLAALTSLGPAVSGHRPWPRHRLDRAGWADLVTSLGQRPDWALLGLWADEPATVHLALRDEADGAIGVASLPCPGRRFPSLSVVRPSAIRLERAIQDLFGLTAEGLTDPRPWLDHDRWPQRWPMAAVAAPPLARPSTHPMLPVEGEGLHQIPVGPVHAGIIEPGHFRFTVHGETVVRLEARLGYVHKGIERAMQGLQPDVAVRLAGRISGDSCVAHALGFSRAVEAATGVPAPPRADWLRALLAELERIANHLGDIGAICNDAAFALMQTHMSLLREGVLAACETAFGHRLMMDKVVPGGVAIDLTTDGAAALQAIVKEVLRRLPQLFALYDGTASLLDRTVSTGIVSVALAQRFAAGGPVGRASGRTTDARISPGYPPYGLFALEVPVGRDGDVHGRVLVRFAELRHSLALVSALLEGLPGGPLTAPQPAIAGEGMALVEAFRGELLCWVRLDPSGRVARCHPRDASWFQWPLLEAAVEGNIVADFPLCNKSFNCSYAGVDL